MYIKFKFTKKSHVCWEKIIHAFLAPCERPKNNATRPHALANAPKTLPHALAPLQTPLPPSERRLPLRTLFTKYLDIHSFNSYTFDREQQKF